MKKVVVGFIILICLVFISMLVMVSIDSKDVLKLEDEIRDNTSVDMVQYVNKYDGYYIVLDKEYLYLFNDLYEEIYKIEIEKIHKNKNNYELVYRNNTIMYMDSYTKTDGIVFKYFDIFTYEVIDEVVIGG